MVMRSPARNNDGPLMPRCEIEHVEFEVESEHKECVQADCGYDGGLSGGVCIAARLKVDLWTNEGQQVLCQGRLVFAFLKLPKLGTVVVYPTYLVASIWIKPQNLAILAHILEHAASHGKPIIAAGDYNNDPDGIQVAAPWGQIKASVVWDVDNTTCVTGCSATVRDYFIVSDSLLAVANAPKVVTSTRVPTHQPVEIIFATEPLNVKVQVLAKPKI